ncbi:unnamed protein product [Rhizophagus irregularis]|nr:unnamed protein product [Rhizophagus irregularis]
MRLSLISYQQLMNYINFFFLVPTTSSRDRIPAPSNEPITKNHPLSCDTSRKIDYSAKLNEILNQEELSIKFIIDEEREFLKK